MSFNWPSWRNHILSQQLWYIMVSMVAMFWNQMTLRWSNLAARLCLMSAIFVVQYLQVKLSSLTVSPWSIGFPHVSAQSLKTSARKGVVLIDKVAKDTPHISAYCVECRTIPSCDFEDLPVSQISSVSSWGASVFGRTFGAWHHGAGWTFGLPLCGSFSWEATGMDLGRWATSF